MSDENDMLTMTALGRFEPGDIDPEAFHVLLTGSPRAVGRAGQFLGEAVELTTAATLARAERAEAELAKLADPNAVHVSMLAGTVAKPSWDQIKHIYAEEAERAEAALAEAVEALRKIAKPRYGLQAVMEDGGGADDISDYYQSVCAQYQSIARTILARAERAEAFAARCNEVVDAAVAERTEELRAEVDELQAALAEAVTVVTAIRGNLAKITPMSIKDKNRISDAIEMADATLARIQEAPQ